MIVRSVKLFKHEAKQTLLNCIFKRFILCDDRSLYERWRGFSWPCTKSWMLCMMDGSSLNNRLDIWNVFSDLSLNFDFCLPVFDVFRAEFKRDKWWYSVAHNLYWYDLSCKSGLVQLSWFRFLKYEYEMRKLLWFCPRQ